MAIKAHFVGKTERVGDEVRPVEYLNGIPARNLSDEEYDALDKEQKALVRSSPLYKMADSKPAEKGAD